MELRLTKSTKGDVMETIIHFIDAGDYRPDELTPDQFVMLAIQEKAFDIGKSEHVIDFTPRETMYWHVNTPIFTIEQTYDNINKLTVELKRFFKEVREDESKN